MTTSDDALHLLARGAECGRALAGIEHADAALYPLSRLAVRGGVRVDGVAYSAEDRVDARGQPAVAQARAAQVGSRSPCFAFHGVVKSVIALTETEAAFQESGRAHAEVVAALLNPCHQSLGWVVDELRRS